LAGARATSARFPAVRESAGHYESYYLKACHPEEPMGVWIRYTVHKPPGEKPKGSVWFTFFEAGAGGPVAAKTTVPDPVAGERDWIKVGEAAGMGDGRAYGWAGEAWWELSFEPYEAPLFHLPNSLMYRSKLPKTKLCSPAPFAVFGGRMGIGERQIPLDGWRGMVGHNWGSEHAERWIWLHAITDDGDWLDAAIGRVTMGSKTTPWIANGAVSIDGERFSLGGLGAGAEVKAMPGLCEFHLTTRRLVLSGDVSAALEDCVAWVYADPAGGEHHSINCSVADMRVRVDAKERPVKAFEVRGGAAYELGIRETDHGVKVQPFPDG
jgi:hypothetical protein